MVAQKRNRNSKLLIWRWDTRHLFLWYYTLACNTQQCVDQLQFIHSHKALREKENKARIKMMNQHAPLNIYAVTSQWKRRSWLPYKLWQNSCRVDWIWLLTSMGALPFAKYDHHHHYHLSSYIHTYKISTQSKHLCGQRFLKVYYIYQRLQTLSSSRWKSMPTNG